MDSQDQINEIKQELQALQDSIIKQYHKVQELQGRLQQIDPTYIPDQKASASTEKPTRWKWENFIGLRLIHLAGIIVLVIGLSIGVKYAIDRELISEVARIALAYSAGLLLFVLSLRLKKEYNLFSAILFSGAMASLYFTTYAAVVYYQMVPPAVAFILMVLFTIYTAMQAIAYNRQEIAVLGLAGAYGIPFLISQNSDRADLFFLYIFIINSGILYLYYKMRWKGVGRIAIILTWMVFLGWCSMRYTPNQWGTGVFAGISFFLLFSLMLLVRGIRYKEPLEKEDAYMQVINNTVLFFAALVLAGHYKSDDVLPALTGGFAIFTGIQTWMYRKYFSNDEPLYRLHLVGSFMLAIVYVLLEWDGVMVTFIWMLMAIIVFAWGAWQKLVVLRLSAMGLMGVTLLKLVLWDSATFSPIQKVISYISLGILLLMVSFFYQKFKQNLFTDKE